MVRPARLPDLPITGDSLDKATKQEDLLENLDVVCAFYHNDFDKELFSFPAADIWNTFPNGTPGINSTDLEL